jgi:HlyD family secretion protein
MRLLLLVIAMGSLAALLSLGQGFREASVYKPPEPGAGRPVDLATDRVAADGVVEGARPEAALRTDVAGTLAMVYVKEGQPVRRGEKLAELRNQSQVLQVKLATAELSIERARLAKLINGERPERRKALEAAEEAKKLTYAQAKGAYDRTQRLKAAGATSREESDRESYGVERARAEMEEAAAEHALVEAPARLDEVAVAEGLVAVAESKLRLAQAELAKTILQAPTDGRILRVFAEPGEVAGPTTAEPVLLMADLSHIRVRAFVEELDASKVRPGQTATVTADGLPGKHFPGKVVHVAPRMGRRAPQTDAPGEYKDLYYREVLIEPEGAEQLPLNFRVLARIRVEP